MPQPKDDLSRSLVALGQQRTLIVVVELSLAAWLVGGIVVGIEREPMKKVAPDARSCSGCCIAGEMKLSRQAKPSNALSWRSKPAAMGSGWRAGCAAKGSKRMSFIRPASQSLDCGHANTRNLFAPLA